MNKNQFEDLHNKVSIKACALLKTKGKLKHTALLGKNNDLHLVPINGGGLDIYNTLQPMCRAIGAEYLFILSEAWMAPPNEGRASQHPDRTEVIFISAEHITFGQRILQFEIIRNSKKKIVNLKSVGESISEIGGRLTSLLTGGTGTGEAVNIGKHPGYKAHFKDTEYNIH